MGGIRIGRDKTLRRNILDEIGISGHSRIHWNQLSLMQAQKPGTGTEDEEGLEADYGVPGFICHCEIPFEILIRGGRLSDAAGAGNFIPGLVGNCFSANNPLEFLQFRALKKLNYEEGRVDLWFNPLYWLITPHPNPATILDADGGFRLVYDPGSMELRFYPNFGAIPLVYSYYDASTWNAFTTGWQKITIMWDFDDQIFSMYVNNLKASIAGAITTADRPSLDWDSWLLIGTDSTLTESMAGCVDEINTRTNRFDIPGVEQILVENPSTYLDAGSAQTYTILAYGPGFEYVKPIVIQSYRPITNHNQTVKIMEGGFQNERCGYILTSPDKYSKSYRVFNQDHVRVYFDMFGINLGAY